MTVPLSKSESGDVVLRSDGYVLIIDQGGTRFRLERDGGAGAVLRLWLAMVLAAVGVVVLALGGRDSVPAGVIGLTSGAVFGLWWGLGRTRPAAVTVAAGTLISRGRFGRSHLAEQADIDVLGIGVRGIWVPTPYQSGSFYSVTPYVQLRDGQSFWLYGLAAQGNSRSDLPPPQLQQEAVHRIRTILDVPAPFRERQRHKPARRRRERRKRRT